MSDRPSISVITASYNQGGFIRDTIESVLRQKSENWQHVVVDGGSTDETVPILEQYPHLKWVSEPDRGQTDALNKGMRMSDGELIFWINSDDMVADRAFEAARGFFSTHPDASIVCGNAVVIDGEGNETLRMGPRVRPEQLRRPWNGSTSMHQPSIVFRRRVWEAVGGFDDRLQFAMDYDFFLRASKEHEFHHLPVDFGLFRKYSGTKTGDGTVQSFHEVRECLIRYVQESGDGSVRWTRLRTYFAEACAWVNDAIEHYESGHPRTARKLLARALLRYPPSLFRFPHVRFRLRQILGPSAWLALKNQLVRGP